MPKQKENNTVMQILTADNVSFSFTCKPLLKDLSFYLEKGSFTSVAGPNGAGKSTLLQLVSGFLKPLTGSVCIDGHNTAAVGAGKVASLLSLVRQEFTPVFNYSVKESVLMARTLKFGPFGFEKDADIKAVKAALEMTETLGFADRPLSSLSGGERQRVYIARAIAQDSPVIALDEPTSFLDIKHQNSVYQLLRRLQSRGRSILAVSHDINLARMYSDKVLLLSAGTDYCFGDTEEVMTKENIETYFGVRVKTVTDGDFCYFHPVRD